MKILVFSDSHGFDSRIVSMLDAEPECKTVFFLGDGLREVEDIKGDYPDIKFITVRGNNDYDSLCDTVAYQHISGVTIMATHGHTLDVRRSPGELCRKANSVMANLALYGHTHQRKEYRDPITGVYAVNPGALCLGQYCVIEIKDGTFKVYPKSI